MAGQAEELVARVKPEIWTVPYVLEWMRWKDRIHRIAVDRVIPFYIELDSIKSFLHQM